MVEGFFADLDVVGTEAALAIGERALHQAGDVGFGERLQLEDQRAREQGAVDAEIWILSGGADEDDGAVFNRWQEPVLLRFVEAMHFVDEENGLAAVKLLLFFGFFDQLAQFR